MQSHLKVPGRLPQGGREDGPDLGLQTRVAPVQEAQRVQDVGRVHNHKVVLQVELATDKLEKFKKSAREFSVNVKGHNVFFADFSPRKFSQAKNYRFSIFFLRPFYFSSSRGRALRIIPVNVLRDFGVSRTS